MLIKASNRFDCFLAHEWGEASTGCKTHARVLKISELLKERGISAWVDANCISDHVREEIISGVGASRKFVVFLTSRYMDRLQNKDNNCTVELDYCLDKIGRKGLILVLFEEGLQNRKDWTETARFLFSQDLLYIDLSTTEAVAQNFSKLVERIEA